MRLSDTSKNAVATVISLSFGLVLIELGLRLYSFFFYPKMMVLDDKLGWKHATNVKRTFVNEYGEKALVVQNAHGQRGTYYDFERRKNKFRVLVLGDSFTEGVQVGEEDLFSTILEREYPQLEVINAGVGGYGTVQEYLYLTSEGLRFKPDLVLLMFFQNDLSDNCLSYYPGFGPRPYAVLRNEQVQLREELEFGEYRKFVLPLPFWKILNGQSYLYYFLNSRIYQRSFANRMNQQQKADLRNLDPSQTMEILFSLVVRIKTLLKEKHVEFVLGLVPSREDVQRGSSSLQATVTQFCCQNGVKCVKFLNRFAGATMSGERVYFPVDMHWTKAGHRLAADEIAASVRLLAAVSTPN